MNRSERLATSEQAARDQKICHAARKGVSIGDLTFEYRLTRGRVREILRRHAVDVPKALAAKPENTKRDRDIAAMFRAGDTLQRIGDRYDISKERVRQILLYRFDLSSCDRVRPSPRKEARLAAKDAATRQKYGCTWAQYVALRDMRKPTRAFAAQRCSARARGIEWGFTLWQWWEIWKKSGKWSKRGRGEGYCMCRIGDIGPYAPNNVFIATNSLNVIYAAALRRAAAANEARP